MLPTLRYLCMRVGAISRHKATTTENTRHASKGHTLCPRGLSASSCHLRRFLALDLRILHKSRAGLREAFFLSCPATYKSPRSSNNCRRHDRELAPAEANQKNNNNSRGPTCNFYQSPWGCGRLHTLAHYEHALCHVAGLCCFSPPAGWNAARGPYDKKLSSGLGSMIIRLDDLAGGGWVVTDMTSLDGVASSRKFPNLAHCVHRDSFVRDSEPLGPRTGRGP